MGRLDRGAGGPAGIGLLTLARVLVEFIARDRAVSVGVDPFEVFLLPLGEFLQRDLAVLIGIEPREQVGLGFLGGGRRDREHEHGRGAKHGAQHSGPKAARLRVRHGSIHRLSPVGKNGSRVRSRSRPAVARPAHYHRRSFGVESPEEFFRRPTSG